MALHAKAGHAGCMSTLLVTDTQGKGMKLQSGFLASVKLRPVVAG